MQTTVLSTIKLRSRTVAYRVTRSQAARKLRVRVGPCGVQVVRPAARPEADIAPFLQRNEDWIVRQLDRAEQLRAVIKPPRGAQPNILYRGEPTPIRVTQSPSRRGQNRVTLQNGGLTILCAAGSRTAATRSLENWLRKQARAAIQAHLKSVLPRIKRSLGKLYVMDQRTKWGNCSALGNLSFSWRLIMAPDFVLRYLVTHEAVHLAVPDHSHRFWLTVQSLCPETERARQWLCANAHRLLARLLLNPRSPP